MIERVLPAEVAWAEATADEPPEPLYPGEAALVAQAVEKRRREFAAVRGCARRALAKLDVAPQPILSRASGAPAWPAGVVGSLTHCDGYRAAAVAFASDVVALGIDAEPHRPLPPDVLEAVTSAPERAELDELSELSGLSGLAGAGRGVHPATVLFSAKEALFKAWSPLTGTWLDFTDAQVTIAPPADDPGGDRPPEGAFTARLLVPGATVEGRQVQEFSGRWAVRAGLVLTAVAVLRRPGTPDGTAQGRRHRWQHDDRGPT